MIFREQVSTRPVKHRGRGPVFQGPRLVTVAEGDTLSPLATHARTHAVSVSNLLLKWDAYRRGHMDICSFDKVNVLVSLSGVLTKLLLKCLD